MGISKAKILLKKILNLRASKLPRTGQEFDDFSHDILMTYGLLENESHKHALAAMVLHLGPLEDKKPKAYFARSLFAAQSREVAYQKIQEIREAKKVEPDAPIPSESGSAESGGQRIESAATEVVQNPAG